MKNILLLLLLSYSLFAQSFSARYDLSVGMLGRVAYADLTVVSNGNTYEAKISAISVGIAATLSGNRVETFVSKGKIIDGKYIPDSFVKDRTTTRKTKLQTYSFNHITKENKLIEKRTQRVTKSSFDIISLEITYEDVNETSLKKSTLDTYMDSDALSSYLNAQISCETEDKTLKLIAIGAHNDKNNVTLSCLEGSAKELARLNFSDGIENIYNLHVEPFDEDDEIVDILIAYDNDGLMKEALLGKIFWIGKITAKRVYYKFTKN